MKKRIAITLFTCCLCMAGLMGRLALLSNQNTLSQAAASQSAMVLDIATTRGTIYDCRMRPITNATGEYVAAVLPGKQSADTLLKAVLPEQRVELYQRLEGLSPFRYTVPTDQIYARGLEVFWVPKRYQSVQSAVHILGLCDPATGKGASGLEAAYDKLLTASGGSLKMRYTTDAARRAIDSSPPEVIDTGYRNPAGLVTTLDLTMQIAVEMAMTEIEKGAAVLMDCNTGDILASVSKPVFNPNEPGNAMGNPNAPFINRAFYAYPVGSTFKLLTAATALEQGKTTQRTFTCTGGIEVGGLLFRCHKLIGHGTLDMTAALERSCNPYFISLALEIGGPSLLLKAQQLGFSSSAELAPGLKTQSGTLPQLRDLVAPAAIANFGFGQGELTATPIQIACLVSAMANGGKAVTPRLVEGSTADGISFADSTARYQPRQVILDTAAENLRRMMVEVVQEGSGTRATPAVGGAGGKTASAQTGRFDSRGVEAVHAWFSGFYPAENPQYALVVLVEDGDSGGDVAGPIFKEICDRISGNWAVLP